MYCGLLQAFPQYDGLLLDKAIEIAHRLRPAFDSPTGLPYLFVNLQKVCLLSLHGLKKIQSPYRPGSFWGFDRSC